jgi:hypothetical protein
MRVIQLVALGAVILLMGCDRSVAVPEKAVVEEGIALAIVYDTSGSMNESVRAEGGKMTQKYVIGNRAVSLIVDQLEDFTKTSSIKMHTGLFVFTQASKNGSQAVIPLGPFDPHGIRAWAKNFSTPGGGTPLGDTLRVAGDSVLNSPLTKKHVLVITDGQNTVGSNPEEVMPKLKAVADKKNSVLFVHFVAFDVNASVFAPIKKQGVTVVGAADEKQLNQQVGSILKEKILLEAE